MKVIELNKDVVIEEPITLTIGNFDGLHLGHQTLLNTVKSFSDSKHAALTFDPHPRKYFMGHAYKTLFTIKGKINLFSNKDFDYLIVGKFNQDLANKSVLEFIEILRNLNVKRLVLGKDFRFAKKASGSIEDLKKHFEVIVIDTIKSDETERISTTLIKTYINDGNISEANKLLGYDYHVLGTVEHGNKVGRKLGFPTANIDYEDILLPKTGVYLVKVNIDNKNYYGLANVGFNPTINVSKNKRLEVYILDYNDNSYDKEVIVTFIKRLRDELKFDTVEELIKQMENDEINARNFIEKL